MEPYGSVPVFGYYYPSEYSEQHPIEKHVCDSDDYSPSNPPPPAKNHYVEKLRKQLPCPLDHVRYNPKFPEILPYKTKAIELKPVPPVSTYLSRSQPTRSTPPIQPTQPITSTPSREQSTPLLFRYAASDQYDNFVQRCQFLKKRSPMTNLFLITDKFNNNILHVLFEQKSLQHIDYLLKTENHSDFHQCLRSENNFQITALHQACYYCDDQYLAIFLKKSRNAKKRAYTQIKDFKFKDSKKSTPVHYLFASGKLKTWKIIENFWGRQTLLSFLTTKNRYSQTPITLAIQKNRTTLINYLREHYPEHSELK